MSEATHEKSVQIKGRKSDKAELRGRYQSRAREPVGEGGRHSRLVRKRSVKERGKEDRGIGRYEGHGGSRVNSGCEGGGWMWQEDTKGGAEGSGRTRRVVRGEWERWHATGKREEELAGAEAFLGRTDVA
jgi:hypothetical protein